MRRFAGAMVACGAILVSTVFGADVPAAKVAVVEGTASMLRTGAPDWRPVKPGMMLKAGDQVYTQAESFVEIRYTNGAVLRMDENSKITIQEASETSAKTGSNIGQVWVNMKKMTSQTKSFEVSSPTATAAIRGTVFQMNTAKDSSSDVAVYDGKVQVGPSDDLKAELQKKKAASAEDVTEVPGPEEVPGPFEVPLETWKMIVAGQRISVRKDGKFAQEGFDMKAAAKDDFVKKNQALDVKLAAEK